MRDMVENVKKTQDKIVLFKLKDKEFNLQSVDKAVLLVLLTVVIFLVDYYSHPHRGVADLERRQILSNMIGPITKHLGNYSFSASLAISAVFLKHMFQKVAHSEITQKIVKHGFLFSISSIIALNALIETFPGNNEFLGDFSMGVFAVAIAVAATESTMKSLKQ